jgi:D-amino peptidase
VKIFISADIEGVTGVTNWDETIKGNPDHPEFAKQMTYEVAAACEAANEFGVSEILIKDAHESGRNIDHRLLPQNTKLIRSWAGSLFSMVQELDDSFDAVVFIGYHSAGGRNENPLSHTMNTMVNSVKINDEIASEFTIHSYIASYLDIPVVFLSGDLGICEDAKKASPKIQTVAVKEGKGGSTINIHPELALQMIKTGVKIGLSKTKEELKIEIPKEFKVEIEYQKHIDAYRNASYPGAVQTNEKTIEFNTNDYIEVLRFFNSVI